MKLLEYQSKALLSEFGLPMTTPVVVNSVEAAVRATQDLRGQAVLKAQVPIGGRGKLGGVRMVTGPDQAEQAAADLLSMTIRDLPVKQIAIEPKVSFSREFYVGITWDTTAKLPVALLNLAGGVEVEQQGHRETRCARLDPFRGLHGYQGRELASLAGLRGKSMIAVGAILSKLAEIFIAIDAVTLEINPLVELQNSEFIGLDAHIEIEDDALFRQRRLGDYSWDLSAPITTRPATQLERAAQRIDAMDHRGVAGRVVEFDGDLALLIGGGGASLTVFDAIRRHGGRPANYCEVGGNPTKEKVAALTELLLRKPGVRKLAVIMNVVNNTRADVMAEGVLQGSRHAGLIPADVISVFRVPGSWEQEARAVLARAGVEFLGREVSLERAAQFAVERMDEYVA